MGRASYCEKIGLRKGPWTPEEDKILFNYIMNNEHETWRALPKLAGLLRCGKSCRLRWENYLKPDIKRGSFNKEEERIIIRLHALLGNRWSTIASQLPGRTDNTIKNFWNTHLKKRLFKLGIDPSTHAARAESKLTAPQVCNARHKAQWENARLEAEARLSTESLPSSSNCETGYQINNTVDLITMPDNNAPTDFFSKIWNLEAGKAFRKQSSATTIIESYNDSCHVFDQNHPNGGGDDQVLSSEITKIHRSSGSVPSLPCVSTQNYCGHSLNPHDKRKENGSQLQCNSASYEWIGHCNVKISEALSGFGDMTMGQTEHNVPQGFCSSEELGLAHMHYTGCSELLLDFPDNNNNTGRMITELHTSFGQHSGWPWPELRIEEDNKDCRNNVSTINAHS